TRSRLSSTRDIRLFISFREAMADVQRFDLLDPAEVALHDPLRHDLDPAEASYFGGIEEIEASYFGRRAALRSPRSRRSSSLRRDRDRGAGGRGGLSQRDPPVAVSWLFRRVHGAPRLSTR